MHADHLLTLSISLRQQEAPVFEYILINVKYGGFGFSDEFKQEMKRRGVEYLLDGDDRGNPKVIELFDEMGSRWSSDRYAILRKVAIPAGYGKYAHVHEYDGLEQLQYIDFARVFTKEVKKIMSKNEPSNAFHEILALQAEIDAAKEVWEECDHFNSQWEEY